MFDIKGHTWSIVVLFVKLKLRTNGELLMHPVVTTQISAEQEVVAQ